MSPPFFREASARSLASNPAASTVSPAVPAARGAPLLDRDDAEKKYILNDATLAAYEPAGKIAQALMACLVFSRFAASI
jgi:hypothetical protein